MSGIVDKLGEGVTGFKVGDRVLTQTTYHVCGHCRYCKKGELNHCPEREGIGTKATAALPSTASTGPRASCTSPTT